jgi:methionyl-tRNA formyltransferase
MTNNYKFAYFGGEPLGVPVLEILKEHGIKPSLVIASPDRPAGRNLVLTPPRVKVWAEENGIEVYQPTSYKTTTDNVEGKPLHSVLTDTNWDLFVVVAYNHILPEWLLELPKYKTINLHPSLLPALRGPSPIRSGILEDKKDEIGVSVMLLDKEMDHGPILAQEKTDLNLMLWPIKGLELDTILATQGGNLLARVIKDYLAGIITPTPQNHDLATYTKKFTKEMGEVSIDPKNLPTGEAAYQIYLKICAFDGIGGVYFFYQGKRIKIKNATLDTNKQLVIDSVIPEGKKEMPFSVWLQAN